MEKEEAYKVVKRRQLEDELKAECLRAISERVERYLELSFIKITPNAHWASISAECIRLYRDGYFFACIALCQAVAEALVRFMCERSKFKACKTFEENVETLCRRKIKPDCSRLLKEIWEGRDDYHHLNPGVPTEKTKLQAIAKSKMVALATVESQVFEFKLVNGAIVPRYPKYWPEPHDGLYDVYLRFKP